MSVINLIDGGESNYLDKWRESCESLRTFAEFGQIRAIAETNLWQMVKLQTMRSQIISPTCSIPQKFVTQNTFHRRLIKVENLVCFYRCKFCHHILFRNQITPIHHFLFIMSAFRLISNTKWCKGMSLQSRILHFTTRRKSWSKQLQSSFIAAPVSKKTS